MAVPKRKISKSKRGMRRAHGKNKIQKLNIIENSSGDLCLPHQISPEGEYKGEQVIEE